MFHPQKHEVKLMAAVAQSMRGCVTHCTQFGGSEESTSRDLNLFNWCSCRLVMNNNSFMSLERFYTDFKIIVYLV